MHELALMEELCDLAVRAALDHGAERIHRVQLRLGDRSGVDPRALRQAFAVVQSVIPRDPLRSKPLLDARTQLNLQLVSGTALELVDLEVS